jgi:hypothetical protein
MTRKAPKRRAHRRILHFLRPSLLAVAKKTHYQADIEAATLARLQAQYGTAGITVTESGPSAGNKPS